MVHSSFSCISMKSSRVIGSVVVVVVVSTKKSSDLEMLASYPVPSPSAVKMSYM